MLCELCRRKSAIGSSSTKLIHILIKVGGSGTVESGLDRKQVGFFLSDIIILVGDEV